MSSGNDIHKPKRLPFPWSILACSVNLFGITDSFPRGLRVMFGAREIAIVFTVAKVIARVRKTWTVVELGFIMAGFVGF